MNEQIRQLAEQAGFILWKDEQWNPGDIIDWGSRYDSELEKFAELIVQECCDVLQTENIIHDVYGYSQVFLRKKIKQHFGVE